MKISELLTESQTWASDQKEAIPNVSSVGVPADPNGPHNYYHKYRLGVMMAGAPDDEFDYPPTGQFVDDMVMVGYSPADNVIIDKSIKKFGYKQKTLSNKGSKEAGDVHKVSPVNQWNKNED